jgi:hypothetical protein
MRPRLWDSDEFEDLVKRLLDEFRVPGIAVAVVDGGEICVRVRKLCFWKGLPCS